MSYVVPTRIQAWLQLLALRYAKSEPALSEILNGSKVVVVEGIEHDNLDGGQDGHDIIIFCPMKLLAEINSDLVSRFQDILRENLAAESRSIRGEYIASVHLQVAVSNEELDKAVPIAATPTINPGTLSIWKPGYFRVFISHRDRHKVKAREAGLYPPHVGLGQHQPVERDVAGRTQADFGNSGRHGEKLHDGRTGDSPLPSQPVTEFRAAL